MSDWKSRVTDAIEKGDIDSLRNFIAEDGVNPNQDLQYDIPFGKFTMLHQAISSRQLDVAKFLIDEVGMDPSVQDGSGFDPLFDLVRGDESDAMSLKCFDFLIRAGANPNSVSNNSWEMTPLEGAAHVKNITMMKKLLEAGANPKPDTVKIDGKKCNLIHLAISQNAHPCFGAAMGEDDRIKGMDIIKLVVSAVTASNKEAINELLDEKYTPLDIADKEMEKTFKNGEPDPKEERNRNHILEIIDFLESKGGTRNSSNLPTIPLHEQVEFNDEINADSMSALKEFASVLSLVVYALKRLIKERKEGGGLHQEDRRVIAYASKVLHDFNKKCETFTNLNWKSYDRFNASSAQYVMESLMDHTRPITSLETKALTDIECSLSSIILDINVYDHSYD